MGVANLGRVCTVRLQMLPSALLCQLATAAHLPFSENSLESVSFEVVMNHERYACRGQVP